MTNGDPTKGELYKRKWFYSELGEMYEQDLRDLMQRRLQSQELRNKVMSDWAAINRNRLRYKSEVLELADQANSKSRQLYEERVKSIDRVREVRKSELDLLRKFNPIIIGPATIDSLINETPDTYEYLERGQLPFDFMFFEFSEPFEMGIPFTTSKKNVRAIEFGRSITPGTEKYASMIYYSNGPEDLVSMLVEISSGSPNCFIGQLTNTTLLCADRTNREFEIYNFLIDMNKRKVRYNDFEFAKKNCNPDDPKYMDALATASILAKQDQTLANLVFPNEINLDNLENRAVFTQIPNLCTNLINYINSHNTTMVSRTLPIKRMQGHSGKRGQREFYVVTIKDKIVQEYEPREDSLWHLQEKIVVRGHIRKFRNEQGKIINNTWIPPYIKGPADAPFRDQRYQVLADKVKREQELYYRLGVRNDPTLWMG